MYKKEQKAFFSNLDTKYKIQRKFLKKVKPFFSNNKAEGQKITLVEKFFNDKKDPDFIEENIGKTNVLVHCQAGVSRSATIVIAYMMRKYQYSMDVAVDRVKKRRPYIDPNKGFMKQLREF